MRLKSAFFHLLVTLLVALLVVVPAAATDRADTVQQVYAPKDVPNVRQSDVRRHVSDPASLISSAARDTVDRLLTRLESSTGVQVAVAVVPSVGESTLLDYSVALFRQWGIGGKQRNDGLLILLVADRAKVRFTTGYGLEGHLPDITCKRIQRTYMVPYLQRRDFDSALVSGTRAVCTALSGITPAKNGEGGEGVSVLPVLLFIAVGIVAFLILSKRLSDREHRCPRCRRPALRRISSEECRLAYGRRVRRDTYVCSECGHIVVRDHPLDNGGTGGTGALLGGMFLGSMMGRRGGGYGGGFGGGSFGGDFGGGDTGGGGAES